MGYAYDAICKSCGTKFQVSEGSGMIAMPFHCERCGSDWWWEFGPGGPLDKTANPPPCECGGMFTLEARPRCPQCGSLEFDTDPTGLWLNYD